MKSESTMRSEKFTQSSNWKYIACLIVALAASFIAHSQWTNPVTHQCHPDPYLTKERLVVLFNDFNVDVSASAPKAWVFTQLVNSVRQLYIPEILKLRRETTEQHSDSQEQRLSELMKQYESQSTERYEKRLSELMKQYESQSAERHEQQQSKLMKQYESQSAERHEKRLSELMKQYESQLTERYEKRLSELMKQYESQLAERHEQQLSELMKQYESQSTKRHEKRLSELMKQYESQSRTRTEQQLSELMKRHLKKGAVKVKPMPANTDTLYVSAALDPRRDQVGWSKQGGWGWTDRLDFKVFRFSEIGTIKITVGENSSGGPYRVYAFKHIGTGALPLGWKEVLHFYVFETEQPNTEMISIGRARDLDPERCIFVRGDHAGKLLGWKEDFVFWVPV